MSEAKRLAGVAIFTALAFVVSLLEFPIFPQAGFLKLDFSMCLITLCAFIYGFIPGVISCAIKELLCFAKSSSGGVGELCNFTLTVCFILVPSILYRLRKGLPFVILYFLVSSIVYTFMALLINRYVNFPLYMGGGAKSAFNALWQVIVYFNLIKTLSISLITILFYKRLKNVIIKI